MGVYTRPDSNYYYLLLNGHIDAHGNTRREKTDVRVDAPTSLQRRDNRALAEQLFHARMTALARDGTAGVSKTRITFSDFLDWWVEHKLPQRRGRDREEVILPRLRATFGALSITAIDRQGVQEYITARLTKPTIIAQSRRAKPRAVKAGPSTVNREVDLLKTILQSAVPKYLDASPLYGMKRLATKTPKRRLMSEAEEAKILAVMKPDDKALFLLALDSLVRLTDCLDVKWSDYHTDRVWIADPKAGGGFEVPLSTRTRKAINAVRKKKGSPYIFARRRTAKTERDRRGSVRQMLKRYCAEAGLQYGRAHGGLTFHWATRRTGATRMLSHQVDIGTVQKVGRWRTPDVVLGIYHGLIDADAKRAVEAVSSKKKLPVP